MDDKKSQNHATGDQQMPDPEMIARQLRKPSGEMAAEVGRKMNEGNMAMNKHAISKLDLKPHDHVLEIGMGNGYFVQEIVSENSSIKYTGFDYSREMVEEARVLNAGLVQQGRASFLEGNANKLPFDDRSFDRILTVNTVYFWEDPAQILSEFQRVLKPGGRVVIGLRAREVMENYPFVRYGFTMYTTDELNQLLASNGYKVTEMDVQKENTIELDGESFEAGFVIVSAE